MMGKNKEFEEFHKKIQAIFNDSGLNMSYKVGRGISSSNVSASSEMSFGDKAIHTLLIVESIGGKLWLNLFRNNTWEAPIAVVYAGNTSKMEHCQTVAFLAEYLKLDLHVRLSKKESA